MTLIEALILGLIQGFTEFLPISSSGHLELGSALFAIQDSDNLLFAVAVHFATALSTIVIYRNDIKILTLELFSFRNEEALRFALAIVISMIPVAIAGIFFEEEISSLFGGKIILVGSMLLITGSLLLLTYFLKKDGQNKVSLSNALIIGIAQMFAIAPGISRSGATIATALLLNVSRKEATRFSFLMVLIPIIGAAILKLKDYFETPEIEQKISLVVLTTGFLAAFISGLVACRWMIKIVQQGKLYYFAIYCFLIGVISIFVGFVN